jgi:UDP-2-acetamido-3-amino-2,3-dideoxy-glucuronate N-acetyltransferase
MADVDIGPGGRVASFTSLDGCRIGAESRIGPFVEIRRGASVGARCKIQSHTFTCEGVEIREEVFVGVTKDVIPGATVVGVPACVVAGHRGSHGKPHDAYPAV